MEKPLTQEQLEVLERHIDRLLRSGNENLEFEGIHLENVFAEHFVSEKKICKHCGHPPEAHDRYDYCPWIEGQPDPQTQFEERR